MMAIVDVNVCRFHPVSEFDDSKRSCRRRLAGHNERRRKSAHDSSNKNSAQGTYSFQSFLSSSVLIGSYIAIMIHLCHDLHFGLFIGQNMYTILAASFAHNWDEFIRKDIAETF